VSRNHISNSVDDIASRLFAPRSLCVHYTHNDSKKLMFVCVCVCVIRVQQRKDFRNLCRTSSSRTVFVARTRLKRLNTHTHTYTYKVYILYTLFVCSLYYFTSAPFSSANAAAANVCTLCIGMYICNMIFCP